jgi:hypothetical protein
MWWVVSTIDGHDGWEDDDSVDNLWTRDIAIVRLYEQTKVSRCIKSGWRHPSKSLRRAISRRRGAVRGLSFTGRPASRNGKRMQNAEHPALSSLPQTRVTESEEELENKISLEMLVDHLSRPGSPRS